ncbi:MAG: ROK family protein, partial [Dehalococcoidia bacterium]|nr:ROK family protein [Dehalococcoidia bacterium]
MDKNREHSPVLTVDIGGTKIASAVIGWGGVILAKARGATPESTDEVDLVDAVERVARQALVQADVDLAAMDAVGVSCAGIINTSTGVVVYSPNVDALRRTPLRMLLSQRFGVAVE